MSNQRTASLVIALTCLFSLSSVRSGEATTNIRLSKWQLEQSKTGVVTGRLQLRNQGKDTIEYGAVRLRFCTPDGTSLKKTKWLKFSEMAPGKSRFRKISATTVKDFTVLWLDVRYYLLDSGQPITVGRKKLKTALDEQIDSKKLDAINESFVALGLEKPVRESVENLKKLTARLMPKPEKEVEATASIVPGEVTILGAAMEEGTGKGCGQTFLVEIHNDVGPLASKQLELKITLLDEKGQAVKTFTHVESKPVGKGRSLIKIATKSIPTFATWQAECTY